MEETKYKAYLEERKSLLNASLEEAKLFDKAILTLAAGVFGLSLAFIRQIAPEPEPGTIPFLIIAWAAFGASILSTLISFLISQSACRRQLEILDRWYRKNSDEDKDTKNELATWTSRLNWISILLFIIGVIFLVIFSAANLLP